MPARAKAADTETTVPETMADPVITVNVAVAVKIDPVRWKIAEQSTEDVLTVKIMAEKGIGDAEARKLAVLMIENGLAGMVTKPAGAGVNDVRREIREYVLAQVAALPAFTDADATVELNEARRTNHAAK